MKTILATVIGATPQVLTESLYDLMITRGESIDAVHVITTSYGKTRIGKLLVDNGNGALYRFCRDYDQDATNLNPHIHVITAADGTELDDIRDAADNLAAANFITAKVQELCSDPNNRILASLAGGRKTMSTYMGFAMQLFARPQDRLFHVLIAPKVLEFNPYFFYPPPGDEDFELPGRDEKPITIRRCDLELTQAEIDFIRLKDQIPSFGTNATLDYEEMIACTQKELNSNTRIQEVQIDFVQKEVRFITASNAFTVRLKPQELYYYAFLVKEGPVCVSGSEDSEKVSNKILQFYNRYSKSMKYNKDSFEAKRLWELRSGINNSFKKTIDNVLIVRLVEVITRDTQHSVAIDSKKLIIIKH